MKTYRDPYKGFKLERLGAERYMLTPKINSIRLPKCYTASRLPSGEWHVLNYASRALKDGSSLHVRITAACNFQYYGRDIEAA